MIVKKINDTLWLCDLDPAPTVFFSAANADTYEEKEKVRIANKRREKALEEWNRKYTACKKLPTLPEHFDYFSRFGEDEPIVEGFDYLIAKAYAGGASIKDGNGTPTHYETYHREIAIPIDCNPTDFEKIILPELVESCSSYSTKDLYGKSDIDFVKIGTIFAEQCQKASSELPQALWRMKKDELLSILEWFRNHILKDG